MPQYRDGKRPNLEGLLIEKSAVGGVFSAKEAQEHGVSRQMLSYYEKQGRLVRLRHGVYKSALFPPNRYDFIFGATVASPGTAVAGPSALDLHQVGHLESREVWLRPTDNQSPRVQPEGTRLIDKPLPPTQTIDLGGIQVESVAEAIKTAAKEGNYDPDQIEEVLNDARSQGLL